MAARTIGLRTKRKTAMFRRILVIAAAIAAGFGLGVWQEADDHKVSKKAKELKKKAADKIGEVKESLKKEADKVAEAVEEQPEAPQAPQEPGPGENADEGPKE